MQFPDLTRYFTGVLIPVSALRSNESIGIGEYADLPALGRWCRDVGLDLIQLLPVNDTGSESSPYSAMSAFALHPVYLRIADLPELAEMEQDDRTAIENNLAAVRTEHSKERRIAYHELQTKKMALLSEVFAAAIGTGGSPPELQTFIRSNAWVREYAAFRALKDRYDNRSWKEWPEYRDPSPTDIDAIWADPASQSALEFYAWTQWRLDQQLSRAVDELQKIGIQLKGDLPILMNEESVDVWVHRELFVTAERAGAPPDMFTNQGQNWDLPIYDWDQLAATDYSWWKDRLLHASRYYSAYRIDHVLGFFRIWSISSTNLSGLLGRFSPSAAVSVERLHGIGYDDGRIRWLAEPHLSGERIRTELGEQAQRTIDAALQQIGDEDLYLFSNSIKGERDIQALPLSNKAREWLVKQYADRALVRAAPDPPGVADQYAPTWSFRTCTRYQSLTDSEKKQFESLVEELGGESALIWERQARNLLGFMRDTTDMLTCAEDLGVIPRCVPRVLADLGILGLRIPRWSRDWAADGQPYIPPGEYPFLTVCAPSVHDTSTMRGWWAEDEDRAAFWRTIGLSGEQPDDYDSATARKVISALLSGSSAIAVLQLQDLFALSPGIAPYDPDEERVNVPGTVNEVNWSYRMELGIEELADRTELNEAIVDIVGARRRRSLSGLAAESKNG